MSSDIRLLQRWLRRARPPRSAWWRALLAGLLATATNVALVVGAVVLLVESATRPGLRAVALALIVIELFAFLRSPLRFFERLTAHGLGYAAVTHWRQWLVTVVGQLNFSQWRAYASGDLLERALGDTDELQDLWLRFVVPCVDTAAVMVLGDLVIAFLPPHPHWLSYALILFASQTLGVLALGWSAKAELARDRELRQVRGYYRAQLVELSAVTPELALLHREHFASDRLSKASTSLAHCESALRRAHRRSNLIVVALSLVALAGVVTRPTTSPTWLVAAAFLGLSTFESLNVVRSSLHAAVSVSGGGERLEALDVTPRTGSRTWPRDPTLRVDQLTLKEDGRVLLDNASAFFAPGQHVAIVGESGVGKSTLLRAMAALDDPSSGLVSVDGVALIDLNEDELRHNLAYVTSEPGLTRGLAIDVVTLGRKGSRDPLDDLRALGLAVDPTTRFDELSRGERVRVALARALVTSPAIYLLDEPTAGLGREETARVLALLDTTSATVVVATHDIDVIAWSDDVYELRGAQLQRVNR